MPERSSRRRKTYGQNFLRSGPAVTELVRTAGIRPSDLIVEIGGGSGVLTRELSGVGARVLVVEKDPRYAAELKRTFEPSDRVKVVECDIRDLEFPAEPFRVFANIPFGLTTDILRMLLDDPRIPLTRADLVVQIDVAKKRSGDPSGNKRNLSWAPWWHLRQGTAIPAQLFDPRPSIDAAVLIADSRREPLLPLEDVSLWRGLLDQGFGRAREPIRRALRDVLTGTQFRRLAADAGVDSSASAARLTLDDWLALHDVVKRHVPRSRQPRARSKKPRSRDKPPRRHRRPT